MRIVIMNTSILESFSPTIIVFAYVQYVHKWRKEEGTEDEHL